MSADTVDREIGLQRFHECVESLSATFLPAVRPMYGATKHGLPVQIGTCTLLKIKGERYLITAAHVIDHNTDGQCPVRCWN
jgi:hypothetical protein